MIVALSSFQIYPAVNGGYDTDNLTVRWWYNRGFIDSTTVSVQGGNGQQGFYITSTCTVDVNGIITVPSTDIFSTLDAIDPSPQSIQFFGRLYSGNTPKQWVTAFSSTPTGWVVQDSSPLTYEDLVLQNQAIVLANPPEVFPTFAQMIAYIDSLTPTPLASDVVIGRTELSVAPANALIPIAVGNNDPRMASFVNVLAHGAVGDDTFNNVTAFTNAQIAAAITGAAVYIPVGTFRLTGGFAFTSPVVFAPGASIVKHLGGSISFANIVEADPSQHFASTSVISVTFSGKGAAGGVYPDWWQTNTTPGTTNMTSAIQSAIDAGTSSNTTIKMTGEIYSITNSLTATGISALEIAGDGMYSTRILNQASANKPSFVFTSKQYFILRDFSIIGRIANPNDGIKLVGTTLDPTAFGELTNIGLWPNGIGIHLIDTVTIHINECCYLPSGFGNGATGTAALQLNAILATGDFNNDIHISGLNAVGYATIADGGAGIKWDTPGAGSSQNITITNCEIEGASKRSVDLAGVFDAVVESNYIDASNVRVLRCRYVSVHSNYGGSGGITDTTYTVGDGTAPNASVNVIVEGVTGGSISIDAQAAGCGARDSTFDASPGYVNLGTFPVTQNVRTTGGTQVADQIGAVGIEERARTIPLGQFTTPTFSAGNFTSPTGAWTLASGDVRTYEYQVVGTTMTVNFNLITTTVTGTPAALLIAIPGGYTSASRVSSVFIGNSNGGAFFTSEMEVTSGGVVIILYPALNAVGTWAAGTDNTNVRGSFSFEVS